jgi:hypothetical protein
VTINFKENNKLLIILFGSPLSKEVVTCCEGMKAKGSDMYNDSVQWRYDSLVGSSFIFVGWLG